MRIKTTGTAERAAAAAAATGFSLLATFQLLLALGAPLGHAAWGGAQERLPSGLRIASAFAAVVFVVAALMVLSRAGYRMSPLPLSVARWGIWVLVAVLQEASMERTGLPGCHWLTSFMKAACSNWGTIQQTM